MVVEAAAIWTGWTGVGHADGPGGGTGWRYPEVVPVDAPLTSMGDVDYQGFHLGRRRKLVVVVIHGIGFFDHRFEE